MAVASFTDPLAAHPCSQGSKISRPTFARPLPTDHAPESQQIKLRGLLRDKTYRVAFQDAKERSCTMTGAQLMDQGLTITLKGKEASEIIWLNCPDTPVGP